jgi:hypothetical protein
MPNTIPNKEATPLPPLKFAQIGKICPMTAANPKPNCMFTKYNSLSKA